MTSRWTADFAWVQKLLVALLVVPLLYISCEPNFAAKSNLGVNIHAVNYSDEELHYHVEDPLDQANIAGGESIGRYAGGGIMCCYALPKKWRPDLTVKVIYDLYFPRPAGEQFPTTHHEEIVAIPQYAAPQEMWVVRSVKGVMSIVISDVEPGHAKWPGEVKGWPVPSLAYYRERWDIEIHDAEDSIKNLQALLEEMQNDPEKGAREMWELDAQYDKKELIGYSGYRDQRFQKYLVRNYSESMAEAKERLKKLEASRP